MKTKMSKIVSVLLCLVMLLGMFQMTALASTDNSTYVPTDIETEPPVQQPPVQNQYRETVVIVIGAQEEPVEEDNPDTGAPVFVGAVVGALAAAK